VLLVKPLMNPRPMRAVNKAEIPHVSILKQQCHESIDVGNFAIPNNLNCFYFKQTTPKYLRKFCSNTGPRRF
jgi:hypothetical protein